MSDTNGYMFRVSDPRPGGAGTYMDYFFNDPSGSYWKGVGEARQIVEARAPQGATIDYCGYA